MCVTPHSQESTKHPSSGLGAKSATKLEKWEEYFLDHAVMKLWKFLKIAGTLESGDELIAVQGQSVKGKGKTDVARMIQVEYPLNPYWEFYAWNGILLFWWWYWVSHLSKSENDLKNMHTIPETIFITVFHTLFSHRLIHFVQSVLSRNHRSHWLKFFNSRSHSFISRFFICS